MDYGPEILAAARRYFDSAANWPACERMVGPDGVTVSNDRQNKPIWIARAIPTPAGFAAGIGASKQILKRWMKEHEEFRLVMEAGVSVTERNLLECGSKGAMSPTLGKAALEQLADWKVESERSVSINLVIPPALSDAARARAFPVMGGGDEGKN